MRAILIRALAARVALGTVATFATVSVAQDAATAKVGVFVVIYERGYAYEGSKSIAEQTNIKEHIAYGQTLGHKFLAGGLLGTLSEDNVLGMVVFQAENIEAAKQWVNQDPGVEPGVLNASVRHWQVTSIKAFQGK